MPQIGYVKKETQAEQRTREARRQCLAAMETGNPERARTVIRELAEHSIAEAQSIRSDVLAAYGVAL